MPANISFSAIHSFTIVAKELSFSRAAEVLHITPSAVSHQMKQLENQLGVSLFHRKAQGVQLSQAGIALQQHASKGIKNIQYGIEQSQFASQQQKLVIAVIPSLLQLWLIPRLTDFYEQYPNIELELVALDQLADFSTEQFDGHIHFGSGQYNNLKTKLLSGEQVYPVCHPQLLKQTTEYSLATLINQYKLLFYKAGTEDEPGGINWSDWLQYFEIEKPAVPNKLSFSHVAMALAAAKHQQGIALGWHHMVKDDLDNGQLVRLSNSHLDTTYNYYLVAPDKSWHNQPFNNLSSWLEQQMSDSSKDV